MTSKAQKNSGYPIPATYQTTDIQELCLVIPAGEDFKRAAYSQLLMLGKYWMWKHNEGTTRAKETAETWRLAFLFNEDCGMIDCGQVEDCLESSTIITNIETNITTIEGDITNIEGDVTNITEIINAAPQGGNVTPPITSYEDDILCNAAEYIKDRLISIIDETITDAATITKEEFFTDFLQRGGRDATFLKDLWDYFVASSNPDLLTEVEDAAAEITNTLYCAALDRALFISDLEASSTITEDAKAAVIGALNSITDAQLSLWAFVGAETATGSCSCGNTKVWDFTVSNQGFVANGGNRATYSGGGWMGVNIGYGNIIVFEKTFTWPSDLVLTAVRVYGDNIGGGASFNYFYGTPYVNEAFGSLLPISGGYAYNLGIDKDTRTGFGYEFSIWTDVGQKITRIEADYTGTPSPDW